MTTEPLQGHGFVAARSDSTGCWNGGGCGGLGQDQNQHQHEQPYRNRTGADDLVSERYKKQKTSGAGSEKEVDLILSKALMDLKYEDRNAVEERIHGIGQEKVVEETPEIMQQAMQQFSTILQQKYEADPTHPTMKGYHLAQQNQFAYSTSPHNEQFIIRFIRAERYDLPKAVDRFCSHLNLRLFFFGLDSLRRPLEVDDLRYDAKAGKKESNSRAYKYFKTGSVQILPGRDRAGRRVVFHHCDPKGQTFLDECKVIVYVYTVLSDDEHVQKKGIVSIGILPSNAAAALMHYSDATFFENGTNAQALIYSATHMCLSTTSDFTFRIAKQLLDGLGSQNTAQTRIHQISSTIELQYRLLAFGLPVEDENFPLTSGGVIKTKNHMAWIKLRSNIDALRKREGYVPSTVIECPEPQDVLFSHNHKRDKRQDGNQEFERLVNRFHHDFETAPNRSQQRENIVYTIVEEIVVNRKGRFLVWNQESQWWDHYPPNPDDPICNLGFQFTNSTLAAKIRKKFFERSRRN